MEAVTLMLAHDFSQLPVMQGDRSVKGLFSWKSLGYRLALKRPCEKVADAMESVRTVSAEASIFQVAEILATDEAVLVQASANDNKIVGIITSTDMAEQFGRLGEPFLLIGEIENRVRALIDGKFTVEELNNAKAPGDTERQIESVADLTFGEYVRLLQDPKSWGKCSLHIDRGIFIKRLDEARDVRNDIMHFEPEGVGEEALDSLRQFARFLERLSRLSNH
jgi:predicted transcriptional regulator